MLAVPLGILRYVPGNFPDADAVTPVGLLALLAISAVDSPVAKPFTVNPLIVLEVPSKLVEVEMPVTTALALLIFAVKPEGCVRR